MFRTVFQKNAKFETLKRKTAIFLKWRIVHLDFNFKYLQKFQSLFKNYTRELLVKFIVIFFCSDLT